jgi:hypothetical protein
LVVVAVDSFASPLPQDEAARRMDASTKATGMTINILLFFIFTSVPDQRTKPFIGLRVDGGKEWLSNCGGREKSL